jgi:hypothetical protein
MCADNDASGSSQLHPAAPASPNGQRLFDILAVVAYLKTIGANAATPNFVRGLISSGQLPHVKIGKKFFVSKGALDSWLLSHERRRR